MITHLFLCNSIMIHKLTFSFSKFENIEIFKDIVSIFGRNLMQYNVLEHIFFLVPSNNYTTKIIKFSFLEHHLK